MTELKSTTQQGREAATGTLIDGLIASAIFGATTGALDVLNAGDFTWRTVGIAAGTGCLMAVLTFLRYAYAAPYLRIKALEKPQDPQA